ncbi:hypothetical protein IC175_04090 [Clostridioides sp. ES-S-0123-01]|uniref:hypothetical protein n=1 Tax=Clostridioides sp. ES-S-0123-01 TaxID=2770783 RepID=UPI001D1128FF|nr:hypothetical protein [Clostridioides sp. ES-S-0123-01]
MIKIKSKNLVIIAYLYLIIPILIFFMTWLKLYIGITMSTLLVIAFYKLIKKDYSNDDRFIEINKKTFFYITIVLLIFVYLTGQGGFFFQYSDNSTRNAMLRDLIYFKWPIIYPETGNGLVYYFMHWIIPAFIAKLFINTSYAFLIGRIALFIWTFIGVFIVILLINQYLKVSRTKLIWIVVIVFIGWGGINIIGGIVSNTFSLIDFDLNTYGWWTNFTINNQPFGYMYRSNMDQLCSTYNQTIAPWIAIVILLLNKQKIRNFAFLGLCILPYAPLPFLGLFIIMFSLGMRYVYIEGICRKNYTKVLKEVFSCQNILAVFTIFVVFLLFFSCNVAYSGGVEGASTGLYVPLKEYGAIRLIVLFSFYVLSFGLYMYFILEDNKNNFMYIIIGISLVIIPFFRIGKLADFCWNVSVPAYFCLMILVTEFLLDKIRYNREINLKFVGLIICLSLSFLNPISQACFGIKIAIIEKNVFLMVDNTVTFSDKNIGDEGTEAMDLHNYLVPQPYNKPFYKYLAK